MQVSIDILLSKEKLPYCYTNHVFKLTIMKYLWGTTLLWAFSFSLIGVYLAGQVDPYFSVWTRTLLAFLVFLPFLLRSRTDLKTAIKLCGIGALQLGCMYLFYYRSFLYLKVPEVLVFTIFTPVYITLLSDFLDRHFSLSYLLTATLAVCGTAVIRYSGLSHNFITGFLLVQGANICFASGQVFYRRMLLKQETQIPQHTTFGYFFLGALIVSSVAWGMFGGSAYPETSLQWGVLIWLGVGASGIGYFFWNRGATQVNTGALAIMNNAVIPLGLIVNLLLWNQSVNLLRLVAGGSIMVLALLLNEWIIRHRSKQTYALKNATTKGV